MIRAIVWKELREQGLIALSLVVLGSGVLVAAAMLADPPVESASPTDVIRFLGLGRLATLMLAVTAGMVCGGAVFAAEREAGTMSFLESLPYSQWQLWRAKLIAGLTLAILQVTLLVTVATGLGFVPTVGWAVAVIAYSILAFAWGMFGSTTARTTLGSVGLAIPVAMVTAIVLLVPIVLFFQRPGSALPRPIGAGLFLVSMFLFPFGVSAWQFTRLDRERAADEPTRARRARLGLSAVQWLTVRQSAVHGLVISGFALLFGLILLAPGLQPFLLWPELALIAGILAGVTAFSDEQTRGSARFWGEQRLPLGRMWLVKIGLHLLFCLWLLLLLAAPLVIRAQVRDGIGVINRHTSLAVVFNSLLFDELGRQGWKYLLVPAVYGFAAGHLAGLVFRKLVVACGVAMIVGGVGVVAWIPSLLAGGVRHWQLWLPPIVALLTGRLLMRAWTSDRLGARAPLGTLIGGCAAVVLMLVVGLGYRVLEVPDRQNGEDDIGYVAGLLLFDQNHAGRDFKTAAERYARLATATSTEYDQRAMRQRPSPTGGRAVRIEERLGMAVARSGWPGDDPELGAWLDRLFGQTRPGSEDAPWYVLAEGAAAQPVGIYEYPQTMTVTGSSALALENARRMAVALLARGLQRQAAGDPAAFVPALRTTLALARTLRNGSGIDALRSGNDVERTALAALDRWLSLPPAAAWAAGQRTVLVRIPGAEAAVAAGDAWIERVIPSSAVIGEAAKLLEGTDVTEPFDPGPYFMAERYALRELQKAPGQWLPSRITPHGGNPEAANAEVDLVGLSWAVPWERERTRRLLGLGFEAGPPNDYALTVGRPGAEFLTPRNRSTTELAESERALRGIRRAAILKLALRAYQADRGRYPDPQSEMLTGLVTAGYLRRLPTDPYDGTRALGYRISRGETLHPLPHSLPSPNFLPGGSAGSVTVHAGQVILWSVGPDRIDQGGQNPSSPTGTGSSGDPVYLVPIGPDR